MENKFLNENLMRNVSIVSAVCGVIVLILSGISGQQTYLLLFERIVKIGMTLLTLWTFSRFHWDAMKGMMGGLLFALMYQESFLVLGQLWGNTTDFDTYLIMGVQGSLYLAVEGMSFLMTVIIVVNHFIINYSPIGNFGNVLFNQISIIFKILLYISLMIINVYLKEPVLSQISGVFECISDLCIVIMVICIDTQLDSFKTIRQELLALKKDMGGRS